MNVIPVVNCNDAACIQACVVAAKTFLNKGELLHLDVTDGVFTMHQTANNPEVWKNLQTPFFFEVHLMVVHPEEYLLPWIAAGAKRIIVHCESLDDQSLTKIISLCGERNVEVMLASNPDTPKEALAPYCGRLRAFQVLAVRPGAPGQELLPEVLGKITFLREAAPDATSEVEGGINAETAAIVKSAGADLVVSGTYIFESPDPKQAYETLKHI